jgi:enoyl-CoA hydratase/carnithine racemase
MFGGMKLASDADTKLVTLTWNDTTTASLELDDPSTFNAMTSSLLENLGRCLTAALASTEM